MNQKNLDYLKENLKYHGFGEKLYPELQKNIEQGFPEFKLSMQNEYGKDKLNADLYFRRSDQSDMYFFNRYDAKLTNEKESQSQSFYLNKGSGVTLKEAYNLLEGRAVNKDLINNEGQKYNAWMQLDFKNQDENGNYKMKQFHQNYGYDLEKALSVLPVKELNNPEEKEKLVRSLEKGNIQSVSFEKDGNQERMFVEANPQFKTVNVYDGQMKKIQKDVSHQRQSTGQASAKDLKQEQNKEVKEEKSEKQTLQPGKQNNENSLLPKKRTNNKGLSIS